MCRGQYPKLLHRKVRHFSVSFLHESNDAALSCQYFLNIRLDLREQSVVQSQCKGRKMRIYEGYGTMLHLTGGIPFGMNVRKFLEFKSSFQRKGMALTSSEVKETAC